MVLTHGFVKKERRTSPRTCGWHGIGGGSGKVHPVTSDANPHLGTALDDLLAEDGPLGSVSVPASGGSGGRQGKYRRSLSQITQSGYEVYVSQEGRPLELVTDGSAPALGVHATEWDSDAWEMVLGRIYLNFEPRTPSDLYVVYHAAASSLHLPQELCVNRRGAGGDTVYVNGLGYIFSQCHEPGHAIRLGGVGDVYRTSGPGHAIRYDGEGQLPAGDCYDLIRRHLGRVARIARVSPTAPDFDPGHGDVERFEHGGMAVRGGDGPGTVRGDKCQDDRPKRGRRRPCLYHNWPLDKEDREEKELEYCLQSWAASDPSLDGHDLAYVGRGEKPDRVVRNQRTGEEYRVELTAVYLDDRSAVDNHRMVRSQMTPLLSRDPAEIHAYLNCIARRVQNAVGKAHSYDQRQDLILAMYLNEFIDLESNELERFVRQHPAFQNIAPFVRIVFTGIGHGVVYP